jgi:uncharacterized membrane protein
VASETPRPRPPRRRLPNPLRSEAEAFRTLVYFVVFVAVVVAIVLIVQAAT